MLLFLGALALPPFWILAEILENVAFLGGKARILLRASFPFSLPTHQKNRKQNRAHPTDSHVHLACLQSSIGGSTANDNTETAAVSAVASSVSECCDGVQEKGKVKGTEGGQRGQGGGSSRGWTGTEGTGSTDAATDNR